MNPVIDKALPEIKHLCARHHVAQLYLFGSATGHAFSNSSDIDFVVAFQPDVISEYADNYFSLLQSLETVLSRRVDLVSERAIRNPYFLEAMEESKVLLYNGQAAA